MVVPTGFCGVFAVDVPMLFNPRIIDEIGHGIGSV